jgi:hypothetical protein
LQFTGRSERFGLRLFEGKDVPIKITPRNIQIGDYEFPKSDVRLSACFPNPFNPERYVVLDLWGDNVKSEVYENWVDYTISRDGPWGKGEILLHGFFDKKGRNWKFSDSLAYGPTLSKRFCKKGICALPNVRTAEPEKPNRKIPKPENRTTPKGELWTLGGSNCRFPSLLVDGEGICWVTWEEQGDIVLAQVNEKSNQKIIWVEDNTSDSFNPLLAMEGENLWIFYLNNQDGFYRLYGRYFDGGNLSEEFLFSQIGPFDVITPAVAFNDQGKMILAWSEWKANNKLLKYRIIEKRIPGEIQTAQVKNTDFAWWPSLIMDKKGEVWGAWNQHYPDNDVYAGDLVHEAEGITQEENPEEWGDYGGYPSIIFDKDGKPWVFWESLMWNKWRNPQYISGSYYNAQEKKWSLKYNLSSEKQTFFNQTPKAAVDPDGVIWVVWSGKKEDFDPWNIYVSRFNGDKWSEPEVISPKNENARAPAIFIDKNGDKWITWHSGIGSKMKVKVMRLSEKVKET